MDQLRAAPLASFTVLHGSSIGGGLLLGLTADHRVATKDATFRLGVAPYGLSPIVMATQVLPMPVGHSYATRMYVEDLSINGGHGLWSGISSHLLPDTWTARRFANLSANANSRLVKSVANAAKCRRHSQETVLNVETSNLVSQHLKETGWRVRQILSKKRLTLASPRKVSCLKVPPV